MTKLRRILLAVAVVIVAGSLLLGFIPTRGEAIVSMEPRGGEVYGNVNCGSTFYSTKWSQADGCEAPLFTRLGMMFLGGLIGLAAGTVGIVLLMVERRHRAVPDHGWR